MVNIKDIKEFEPHKTYKSVNAIKIIFDEQQKLLKKYRKVEKIPLEININNPLHQKLLKEFTFRGIEELAEGYEAYSDENVTHFIEELSDALHFFTELMIMTGFSYKDICKSSGFPAKELKAKGKRIDISNFEEAIEIWLWDVTYFFSIACNKLKCKPWKKTQILVDIDDYKAKLLRAYNCFLMMLCEIGLNSQDILKIYLDKNLVNKFRIRSNY